MNTIFGTTQEAPNQRFDAIVLIVAHKEFLKMNLNSLKNEAAVVYDVKRVIKIPMQSYRSIYTTIKKYFTNTTKIQAWKQLN